MKSFKMIAPVVVLMLVSLCSFTMNEPGPMPKKGQNILSYISKADLSRSNDLIMQDKELRQEFQRKREMLDPAKSICYGVWSDDQTICRRSPGVASANRNAVSSITSTSRKASEKPKPYTRYGILYNCETYEIYGVWQIGY